MLDGNRDLQCSESKRNKKRRIRRSQRDRHSLLKTLKRWIKLKISLLPPKGSKEVQMENYKLIKKRWKKRKKSNLKIDLKQLV